MILGHMPPGSTRKDLRYGLLSNAELFADCRKGFSICPIRSDVSDHRWGEFRSTMPALPGHVHVIIMATAEPQMRRIATGSTIAFVAYINSCGYRSMRESPGQPVCRFSAVSNSPKGHHSITISPNGGGPVPAFPGLTDLDLLPEAFLDRSLWPSHKVSITQMVQEPTP